MQLACLRKKVIFLCAFLVRYDIPYVEEPNLKNGLSSCYPAALTEASTSTCLSVASNVPTLAAIEFTSAAMEKGNTGGCDDGNI